MFLHYFILLIGFYLFQPNEKTGKGCKAEEQLEKLGLIDIQKLKPEIRVDLKYSSRDNFVGIDVYGCLSKAYLQKPVAQKLAKAAEILKSEKPGFFLLVYDAARPKWAQQILWDSIKKPESLKHIYVANPKRGSMHNYGCAVDLTVVDSKGIPLDMGTKFDYFGNLAQPRLEQKNFKKGLLSKTQMANRALLRSVMGKAGFNHTSSEWWHFNYGSLNLAKSKFSLIL